MSDIKKITRHRKKATRCEPEKGLKNDIHNIKHACLEYKKHYI